LYGCANVQTVPACQPQQLAGATRPPEEVAAAFDELTGQRVRVRGRLDKYSALSTMMNCDGTETPCCNEWLDLRLAVGKLTLEGEYRAPGGHAGTLLCRSHDGMMVQSLTDSASAPLLFERWDRKSRGEPQRQSLQPALCCNLYAHGQNVIVEGTLAAEKQYAGPKRLLDPFLCELK
jgi:hypothetical protein